MSNIKYKTDKERKEARKKSRRKEYMKHKKRYKERGRIYKHKRNKEIRDLVDNFKKQHVCAKCGFSDWRALLFHHIGEKKFSISKAVAMGYTAEKVKEEMDKCILICANCHLILHKGEWNAKYLE